MSDIETFIIDNFDTAIRSGHIKAYYQPVFRALTKNISTAEALARWEDPDRGIISPGDFIPILEKHGMAAKLDFHILKCICDTYKALKEVSSKIPPFSINLSRLDFSNSMLCDEFVKLLKENDMPSDAIRVEITESLMINDSMDFRNVLDKFRLAGFRIWMDDFGSGYSSLNVLKNYSFDLLKLDFLFLQDFGENSKQMLSAVINMAKALKLHTLAEGIETEEQYNFLLDSGCELIQGYYLSKPKTEADYIEFIRKHEDIIEKEDEVSYWDSIGQFNFLSPNPLDSFIFQPEDAEEQVDTEDHYSRIPLALIEYHDGHTHCIYYNKEYKKRILKLGYSSVDDVERSFNAREQSQHITMVEILNQSIRDNSIQRIDCVENGILFTIKTKCIAKHDEKYMMAITLSTSNTDRIERKADELLISGQSLFQTYNLITFVYPSTNSSERIYNAEGLAVDYSKMPLRVGIKEFCDHELMPDDRERYMQFFDLDTLESRVTAEKQQFIQQPFRIKKPEGYTWVMIRITKLAHDNLNGYLYTLQLLGDMASSAISLLMEKHPDYFNRR